MIKSDEIWASLQNVSKRFDGTCALSLYILSILFSVFANLQLSSLLFQLPSISLLLYYPPSLLILFTFGFSYLSDCSSLSLCPFCPLISLHFPFALYLRFSTISSDIRRTSISSVPSPPVLGAIVSMGPIVWSDSEFHAFGVAFTNELAGSRTNRQPVELCHCRHEDVWMRCL